jgi:hypothetical protein
MGPIERELREACSHWRDGRYDLGSYPRLSNLAAHLVSGGWNFLPTGIYAYANIEDAWSEAIECAGAFEA